MVVLLCDGLVWIGLDGLLVAWCLVWGSKFEGQKVKLAAMVCGVGGTTGRQMRYVRTFRGSIYATVGQLWVARRAPCLAIATVPYVTYQVQYRTMVSV
jgi:hypothetical protein